MKKLSFLFFSIFIVLIGCSGEVQNTGEVHFIEVEIQTPEKIEPNEEIEISAFVTQGEEEVNDANEVKFEIWKNGQEDHEMVEGNHKGEGIYSITKTFDKDGIYSVVAHVTARDMHSMPKKEFVVGDPS
ncbi:FixH family protein [Cytobacillus sp. S13-E01]|uniref:FixH family protein n=1 Tax=Cytobacillus sp. S13-E01 TaxID=3031326 RepID=UPI0023D82AC5|nr:FixH family protein [Cytobacillus sp. S13-E01]MDF0728383.1 FixH family protein [Cytobacillus sp. S13-E01]